MERQELWWDHDSQSYVNARGDHYAADGKTHLVWSQLADGAWALTVKRRGARAGRYQDQRRAWYVGEPEQPPAPPPRPAARQRSASRARPDRRPAAEPTGLPQHRGRSQEAPRARSSGRRQQPPQPPARPERSAEPHRRDEPTQYRHGYPRLRLPPTADTGGASGSGASSPPAAHGAGRIEEAGDEVVDVPDEIEGTPEDEGQLEEIVLPPPAQRSFRLRRILGEGRPYHCTLDVYKTTVFTDRHGNTGVDAATHLAVRCLEKFFSLEFLSFVGSRSQRRSEVERCLRDAELSDVPITFVHRTTHRDYDERSWDYSENRWHLCKSDICKARNSSFHIDDRRDLLEDIEEHSGGTIGLLVREYQGLPAVVAHLLRYILKIPWPVDDCGPEPVPADRSCRISSD